MNCKGIFYIVLCFLFLLACTDEEGYVLEGNITGLVDPVLYIERFGAKPDTIYSKRGKFKYEAASKTIQPIVISMEDGNVWMTVWAQNGQVIAISGDAEYPELIQISGNEINDLLTFFRQEHRTTIQEWHDTEDEVEKAGIMQILIQHSNDFVRQHPASIASLVLIQDYLVESKDLDAISDALSLITNPAKTSVLYEQLRTVYY